MAPLLIAMACQSCYQITRRAPCSVPSGPRCLRAMETEQWWGQASMGRGDRLLVTCLVACCLCWQCRSVTQRSRLGPVLSHYMGGSPPHPPAITGTGGWWETVAHMADVITREGSPPLFRASSEDGWYMSISARCFGDPRKGRCCIYVQ